MTPEYIPKKCGDCIFSKVMLYPRQAKCKLLDFLFDADIYVYTFEKHKLCPFSNKDFVNGLEKILNKILNEEEEE